MTSTLDSATIESGAQPVTVRSRAPRPLWTDDDLPADVVPERYRLGEAFVPKGRYLDPEFQQLEVDRLFTEDVVDGVSPRGTARRRQLRRVPDRRPLDPDRARIDATRSAATSTPAVTAAPASPPDAAASARSSARSTAGGGTSTARSVSCSTARSSSPRSDEDLGLAAGAGRHVGRVRVHQHGPRRRAAARVPRSDPDGVRAVPLREHALPVDEGRHRCRATGRPCSTGSSRRTTCPARTRSSPAGTSRNHNIATLKELDRRAWSPTAMFGKFARYASLGPKKSAESIFDTTNGPIDDADREELGKDPSNKHIEGAKRRAPLDRRRRAVHRQRHAGARDRTQHPRRGAAPDRRRSRGDDRRPVLPRDAARGRRSPTGSTGR